MDRFQIIVCNPPGLADPSIAIAGSRAGALGVLDLEYIQDVPTALQGIERLAKFAGNGWGIKLDADREEFPATILSSTSAHPGTILFTYPDQTASLQNILSLKKRGHRVLIEAISLEQGTRGEIGWGRCNLMGNLPLENIRVLDLSHSWAAPHCTRILADFGAEVIKVEYVQRLCLLRGARKQAEAYDNHPASFQVNRNKLSITLNLKLEADRQILRELVKISDVFVHNSRTGVMERLGFGYGDLVKIKEDLVVLSMSAFGQTGPYASCAGYGAVFPRGWSV